MYFIFRKKDIIFINFVFQAQGDADGSQREYVTLSGGQSKPEMIGKSQEGRIIVLGQTLGAKSKEVVDIDFGSIFAVVTEGCASACSTRIKSPLMRWKLGLVQPRDYPDEPLGRKSCATVFKGQCCIQVNLTFALNFKEGDIIGVQ